MWTLPGMIPLRPASQATLVAYVEELKGVERLGVVPIDHQAVVGLAADRVRPGGMILRNDPGVLRYLGTVVDRVDCHLVDLGEGVCLCGKHDGHPGLQGLDVGAVAVVAQLAHLHRGGAKGSLRGGQEELAILSEQEEPLGGTQGSFEGGLVLLAVMSIGSASLTAMAEPTKKLK